MEVHVVRRVLALLPDLPQETYLAVNVSPAVAGSESLQQALAGVDCQRVVVELTEQTHLDDVGWAEVVRLLRRSGVRIAVDDTGAGYAGLDRLLQAEPDLIKIDRMIVHGVADDPARQAMVRALRDFARSIGASLIAEGIEDPVDAAALRVLGVECGQGFALGVPLPAPAWLGAHLPETAMLSVGSPDG